MWRLSIIIAALAACVVLPGHAAGQKKPLDPAAMNDLINQGSNFLQNVGIQPSGSIKENQSIWCIFNNWQDRDSYANATGNFDRRFSTGTMFGGKWYCIAK